MESLKKQKSADFTEVECDFDLMWLSTVFVHPQSLLHFAN